MGFFDLFCVALAGGIALSSTATEKRWAEENRSKAIKRGYRTYMDHRGSRRLISNNRLLRETNEPFKFELCDINDHGLGQYIIRSEEHTSELQSRFDLVCRLLLEKKKKKDTSNKRKQ